MTIKYKENVILSKWDGEDNLKYNTPNLRLI